MMFCAFALQPHIYKEKKPLKCSIFWRGTAECGEHSHLEVSASFVLWNESGDTNLASWTRSTLPKWRGQIHKHLIFCTFKPQSRCLCLCPGIRNLNTACSLWALEWHLSHKWWLFLWDGVCTSYLGWLTVAAGQKRILENLPCLFSCVHHVART